MNTIIFDDYNGGNVAMHDEAGERGELTTKSFPDGRVVDLVPLLFGAAKLAVTRPQDEGDGTYDDVWQYQSIAHALEALLEWDGTGEPTGWHRHPATGRRRPGGDPAKEFVRE